MRAALKRTVLFEELAPSDQVLRDAIIAVTDTAYINGEWGEGRLILIDLESEERIRLVTLAIPKRFISLLINSLFSVAVLCRSLAHQEERLQRSASLIYQHSYLVMVDQIRSCPKR